MISSNRLRGLGLLLVTFVVGSVAGVAGDRVWRAREAPPVEARRNERPRVGSENERVESDRIPLPLESLNLSATEEARLHEIARRWRPQAVAALAGIRATVSDFENNMFAEMLCVISKDKQDRYLAQLQESGANNVLIDKRFTLVRSNRCREVEERGGRR